MVDDSLTCNISMDMTFQAYRSSIGLVFPRNLVVWTTVYIVELGHPYFLQVKLMNKDMDLDL